MFRDAQNIDIKDGNRVILTTPETPLHYKCCNEMIPQNTLKGRRKD